MDGTPGSRVQAEWGYKGEKWQRQALCGFSPRRYSRLLLHVMLPAYTLVTSPVSYAGLAGLKPLEDCADYTAWVGFGTVASSLCCGLRLGVAKDAIIHSGDHMLIVCYMCPLLPSVLVFKKPLFP